MLRFLIADEHEIIRRGIKQILLEEFFPAHIEEAGDAESLMNKALNGKWDVVIADLVMSNGSGIAALKRIRQSIPQLPILILSTYPEEQFAHHAMDAGASAYLEKEIAPEELVNTVKQILSVKILGN